jgi:hypothetical protein
MLSRGSLRGLVPPLCLATMAMASGCARGTELVSPLEETGTIVGRVLDSRNGSPIAGVLIVASPGAGSVTTDATGHFELTGLDLEVEYTVTAVKAGYTTSTVRVPVTRAQSFISIEFTLLRFSAR